MPLKITCTQVVQVGSVLQRSASSTVEVDAYDVVEAAVPDGATDQQVDVQPGASVKMLMITSDVYAATLTYKVNATGAGARVLDAPQVLVGAGAIALLDNAAPTTLFFGNASGHDAVVSIVVGRDA